MDIYSYIIKPEYISQYFADKKICLLDIETTGLNRKYNEIYLIGVIYYDELEGNWFLKQFFASHLSNEETLLIKFNNFIKEFNLIVNYNGDYFDIPFIEWRFNKYGIKSNIKNMDSFDIYKQIKANRSYLDIKNLKLKTIEENLGIYREDKHSGKDCIGFYHDYINSNDQTLKEKILKHNYDDLYNLMEIPKMLDIIDSIKTLTIQHNDTAFEIKILDINTVEDVFRISCSTLSSGDNIDTVCFQNAFSINWESNSLVIDIEVQKGMITPAKKAIFIDKKDFPPQLDIADSSQYIVPDDVILLKVENTYITENIKNLIQGLLSMPM